MPEISNTASVSSAPLPTEVEPMVVDMSLFANPQRTIQAMRNCGVIASDEEQSALLVVKRVNHGAFGDYSSGGMPAELKKATEEMQAQFRQKLQTMPYQQLVEEGHVNKLLDDYLGLLVMASDRRLYHLDNETLEGREETDPVRFNDLRAHEEAKRKKYADERAYYAANPEVVKDAARRFEALVREQRYLPIGRILAMSGAAGADLQQASDLVQDVLGVVSARQVKAMLGKFVDDAALQRYEADPKANVVRIKALAETIAGMTSPLTSLRGFEKESPQLDRINALKTLLSAQLHYAIMQERSPEQCIAVEREARHHVKESAEALMSLAHDYLGSGPAVGDSRVQAIRANLKAEMDRDGIRLLPASEAAQRAAILARKSAEDLLQAAHGDAQLTGRIEVLAEAAGVQVAAMPLQKTPHLIGEDLLEVLREKLAQRNVVVPDAETLAGFLQKEYKRREAGGQSPIIAA